MSLNISKAKKLEQIRETAPKPFPYYVGLYSLEELVTSQSRVCVINILGTESRKVTPVSHEYSGGNVVAGVQYGRCGELETRIGKIPVFRSVRDVMKEGLFFDVGVIYLPPPAVSQAVWELASYNKELKRIVIVTEKISTKDSHNIRWICQEAGIDVIGANCLGVANVWDHVRIGGALGGDNPDEALKKGSIAIHSNSGNFTTTIAEYLRTAGFGITTAVSSGKDVFIHFALPEFLFAAQNDPRTKAVVLYVEPGGYYEKTALDWIKQRRFGFNKPIVVCITGRWKKDLQRPCGHAGAMAGSGDDAETKERWFDEYFDMEAFDPGAPKVSKKGIRVTSIQHIPAAMRSVYEKIDESPDFEASGDLNLKCWLSDTFISLPNKLDIPTVNAIEPYDKQITEINKLVGAHYLRQNMRNKSSVSRLNPKNHIAELHGKTVVELATHSYEENVYFSLAKVLPDEKRKMIVNMMLNLFVRMDEKEMETVDDARANGCTPNGYISSRIALIGQSEFVRNVSNNISMLIDIMREFGVDEITEKYPRALDKLVEDKFFVKGEKKEDEVCQSMLKEIRNFAADSGPLKFCLYILKKAETKKKTVKNLYEFLVANLALSLFWKPMMQKRMTRETVENAAQYIYVISRINAFSVNDRKNNPFWNKLISDKSDLRTSFTENIFKLLLGRKPDETDLIELQYLLGLTLTNGPGTISAKGAKESVSAGNYIPMCFVGFMANTGLAHGGNGFEAVDYLLEKFKDINLSDPGCETDSIDLNLLANKAAKEYRDYKSMRRESLRSSYKRIPCIGHPVFKGKQVNIDPREEFIRSELKGRGIYNIFLEFYHCLVKELFNEGVTKNVFCVNVDAVLATLSLKLIWDNLKKNKISMKQVQDLVFTLFLLGRSVGVAAEIIDHREKGQDMDCRTPQSELSFVI